MTASARVPRTTEAAEHDALRLWLRLFTCSTMIEQHVGSALKREFGSSLPRFDLLAQLDRSPNGLRMGELCERTLTTGGQPEGVALVGDRVVTADAASGSLTLATSDLSEARTIADGAGPVRVAAFDTDTALVALHGADELVAFDVARGKVEHRLGPVQRPDGICVSPDSAYIGVTSNGDGTLQFFATKDWKPVHSVAFVAGLGACLWLPD